MKPLNIEFTAFGPFPGTHIIDFERLGGHGLFLISGPTGAGKTTVLDAMVFALYGEAAGARKKHTDRLRSDFATPDLETTVAFEFEIRGERYRIERSPSYPRPGLKTAHPASVSLNSHDGSGWKPISTRVREVDARVTELIGLKADQFQQVILLPQGRFAEVLRADSKERLALLRALFETGRFLDAVDLLKAEATTRGEVVKDAERRIDQLFEDVLEQWRVVITQAGDGTAAESGIEFDDNGNPCEPDPTGADALAALAEQASSMVASLVAAAERTNEEYDAANTAASAAESAADRWEQRDRLIGEQAALDALAEDDASRGPELERATAANELLPAVGAAADAKRAHDEARGAVERIGAAIATEFDEERTIDEAGAADLIDQQRTVIETARRAIAEFSTAETERKNERDAMNEAAALERELEQLGAELERTNADLPEQRRAAQEAETAVAGLDAAEVAAAAANHHLENINRGITLDNQIAELDADIATARANTSAARQALDALRERHVSGLAARLAAGLAPGAACPTCGSTDHPRPAEVPDDDATAEQVEEAEAVLETARAAEGRVEQRRAALIGSRAELPPADAIDGATTDAAARIEALLGLQQAAADAERFRSVVERAEQFVAEHSPKVDDLRTRVATAKAAATAAANAASGAEERARSIAPDATNARDTIDRGELLVRTINEYVGYLRRAAETGAAFDARRSALDEALAAKGFTDAEAVHAAAIDPDALGAERAALAERDRRRGEVRGALETLAAQEIPAERPDPTNLVARREQTKAARDAAVEAHGVAAAAAKIVTEAPGRLGKQVAAMTEQVAAAEIAQTVYDVAAGRIVPRIPLESWVCSVYLERVTQQANHHLVAMTGGQYELQIGETSDGRKQGGLDLDVFDLHTGAARSVDTLSGGETFMASMALALGLAEVVAGQQNLMLDALFIDEGFGSLDAETLDRATEVLHRLQTAGRMVGVITHVTEMQKALPTGIAVTKTEQGSTLVVEYPDA